MRNALDRSVLVVGASASGIAVAEGLRRSGHTGTVTLLDGERHRPYDRPPLSKQFLTGGRTVDRIALRPAEAISSLDVTLRQGEHAAHLDVGNRAVTTSEGAVVRADEIVLATGVQPRTLPTETDLAGVYVLRTLDDARALQQRLGTTAPVLVVGNGVLGSELAASIRSTGNPTTLVGSATHPMRAQLGGSGSKLLADMHDTAGVQLVGNARVRRLVGEYGAVTGVMLEDGRVLRAGIVVVAVGSVPATGWLVDSGLDISDGVLCDAMCRAADGIWAAGDVARWYHPGLARHLRLENRTNATEQGLTVARNIVGVPGPYAPVPYFWSDQYGVKIQAYGFPGMGDAEAVVDGSRDDRRFVAISTREGTPVGVLGWGMPKQARLHSRVFAELFAPTATQSV